MSQLGSCMSHAKRIRVGFYVEFPKILGFVGSLDGAGLGPCSGASRHGQRAERSCL